MNKKILITGASGLIGKKIYLNLIAQGHEVTALSKNIYKEDNFVSIDLLNLNDLKKYFNGKEFDILIHCAAVIEPSKLIGESIVSAQNSLITKNLFQASLSLKKSPSWIFLSSVSVYGNIDHEEYIEINDTPTPISDYGKGKLHDEKYLIKNCNELHILRLAPVFDDQHLSNIKKRVYLPGTNFKLNISPSPRYTLCSIKTIISKIINITNCSEGKYLYHVGDQSPYKKNEIAKNFPGMNLNIKREFFEYVINMIPNKYKIFKNLKWLIQKLAFSNVYIIGRKKIES